CVVIFVCSCLQCYCCLHYYIIVVVRMSPLLSFSFFFNATPPTEIYTLSLHDALPISIILFVSWYKVSSFQEGFIWLSIFAMRLRSEEHTSELQSRFDLVCRLLLEKKKNKMMK